MKQIIIFGAGKIGRSFIGQLFGSGGYRVVFVDRFQLVVDALNARGYYDVFIKDLEEYRIRVEGVSAIQSGNEKEVIRQLSETDLVATSVGQPGLPDVIRLIAKGLNARVQKKANTAQDIIIAENLRNAAAFFDSELKKHLPADFPEYLFPGLIETSIGKMVPNRTDADLPNLYAEAYNTLILDKNAFKNEIPSIEGLAPKENMKAWVDRKFFIHILGHAAAAYLGYAKNPALTYIYEVLDDPEIRMEVKDVMMQSADLLLKRYPDVFSRASLDEHIDDLLMRFGNRTLADTIYRVGSDLYRKLGPDDRISGAIRLAWQLELPFDKIFNVLLNASGFSAPDEKGEILPSDQKFLDLYQGNYKRLFSEVCQFDPGQIEKIMQLAGLENT